MKRNANDATMRVFAEIERLGLQANVAQLDAMGYTVLTPPAAAPASLADELVERVAEVSEQRAASHDGQARETYGNETLHYMLLEGLQFEQALMNPVALALITYLLGESCVLSSMVAMRKGPSDVALPLHTDTGPGVPAPFPRYAQVANATWLLSDYTRENGALCFVPGSHHLCRHPAAEPTQPDQNPEAVAIEAPKGSLVVWHGNLWHGAFSRTAPGLRANLVMFFTRLYFRPQEDYTQRVTDELLDRNPRRLRALLGLDHPFPASLADGVDPRRVAALAAASTNIHG